MMSQRKFEFGDRVRHARRPEWGIGSIVKTQDTVFGGNPGQRLSVRAGVPKDRASIEALIAAPGLLDDPRN